jgi:hypothetical protein
MAQFVVIKAAGNDVPALGQVGSADVYRGDHPTLPEAMAAAALKWGLGPGIRMWAVDQTALVRHVTSVTSAVG